MSRPLPPRPLPPIINYDGVGDEYDGIDDYDILGMYNEYDGMSEDEYDGADMYNEYDNLGVDNNVDALRYDNENIDVTNYDCGDIMNYDCGNIMGYDVDGGDANYYDDYDGDGQEDGYDSDGDYENSPEKWKDNLGLEDGERISKKLIKSFVSNKPLAFVIYYANWCGYCKGLKEDVGIDSGKTVWNKFPNVLWIRDERIPSEIHIEGFPTIEKYINGKKSMEKGDVKKEFIKYFKRTYPHSEY